MKGSELPQVEHGAYDNVDILAFGSRDSGVFESFRVRLEFNVYVLTKEDRVRI